MQIARIDVNTAWLSLGVLLIVGSAALAQDCLDYANDGHRQPVVLPGDYPEAIAVHGDWIYAVVITDTTARLHAIDASDPGAPVLFSDQRRPRARALSVHGDLLLATAWIGREISVYSLSDPWRPTFLSTIDGIGGSCSMELIGDHLYGSSADGVRIFDLSDPAAPVQVGVFNEGLSSLSLKHVDGYLYVGCAVGIRVFDLSEPLAPQPVVDLDGWQPILLLPAGDVLYTATFGEVQAIDITDPAAPVLLSTHAAGWNPEGLCLVGSTLIHTTGSDLDMYDVTDPTNLRRLWERPDLYIARNPQLNGRWLYIPHRTADSMAQIEVWDTHVPLLPYAGYANLPHDAARIATRAPFGFVAGGDGLDVIDFTDAAAPAVVAQLSVAPHEGYDLVTLAGPYAVLAGAEDAPVYVIDVSIPSSPVITGAYLPSETTLFTDMEFQQDRLYVASNNDGIMVYAIVDGTLELRDQYWANYYHCYEIELADHHLLARFGGTLRVFDITDPDALVFVGSTEMLGGPSIELHGQHLYRLDSYEITIFDVSEPTQPVQVAAIPESALELTVVGTTAYVAGYHDALLVFDVTDPTQPVHLGSVPIEGYPRDIEPLGDHLVLLDRHSLHRAWTVWPHCLAPTGVDDGDQEQDRPTTPRAVLNPLVTPNPFNPRTEISYDLPQDAEVSVIVYDALGRRVRALIDGRMQARGRHTVSWDGRSATGRVLASGVYLIRIEAGASSTTCKAALLQ